MEPFAVKRLRKTNYYDIWHLCDGHTSVATTPTRLGRICRFFLTYYGLRLWNGVHLTSGLYIINMTIVHAHITNVKMKYLRWTSISIGVPVRYSIEP